MMYVAAGNGSVREVVGLIVERGLETAEIVLDSKSMRSITGETTFILQEIGNIHRLAYYISSISGQQASFLTYLQRVIAADFYAEYVQLLRVTDQYNIRDSDCLSQVNGQLNLLKNLLVRMLEVAPR
jgi:hypothetical protein